MVDGRFVVVTFTLLLGALLVPVPAAEAHHYKVYDYTLPTSSLTLKAGAGPVMGAAITGKVSVDCPLWVCSFNVVDDQNGAGQNYYLCVSEPRYSWQESDCWWITGGFRTMRNWGWITVYVENTGTEGQIHIWRPLKYYSSADIQANHAHERLYVNLGELGAATPLVRDALYALGVDAGLKCYEYRFDFPHDGHPYMLRWPTTNNHGGVTPDLYFRSASGETLGVERGITGDMTGTVPAGTRIVEMCGYADHQWAFVTSGYLEFVFY